MSICQNAVRKFSIKSSPPHHNRFTAIFQGPPGWAGARRKLLLDFMVQGRITEADTPTIRVAATPSGPLNLQLHIIH